MHNHNVLSIQYILNKFIRKVQKFLWDVSVFLVSMKFCICLINFLAKKWDTGFSCPTFPSYFLFSQFIQTFLSEKVEFFLFSEGRTCFLQLGRKVAFLPKYWKAGIKHQIPFSVAFCLGFALGGGSPACSLSKFSCSATDFRTASCGKRW